jgi:hypothetical protein
MILILQDQKNGHRDKFVSRSWRLVRGESRKKPPSIVQLQLGKWIVPISNAPLPIKPVAAVALSIGVAFAVGLLIAFGIICAVA